MDSHFSRSHPIYVHGTPGRGDHLEVKEAQLDGPVLASLPIVLVHSGDDEVFVLELGAVVTVKS